MGALQDTARARQAEMLLGGAWYIGSAITLMLATSFSTALSGLAGFEVWAVWIGRASTLPAIGTLCGFAFLLRHQWLARRDIDRLVPPRVDQREPTIVFASVVIVATLGWSIRPVLDPMTFCLGTLILSVPLLWIGVRARSPSTWFVWVLLAFSLPAATVFAALQIRYGPIQSAAPQDLFFIVGSVLAMAAIALVFATALLVVLGTAFVRAQRLWNRGELEALSKLSYWGLADDLGRVLDAHRLLGNTSEVEERYGRLAAALPLPGAVSLLSETRADLGDPGAVALARAALRAFPTSVQALQVFARLHRRDAPDDALDAVITAQTRGFGGNARQPVFHALEACICAHQGQAGRARELLGSLERGEHPVHAREASLYAAEAHLVLGEVTEAGELLREVVGIAVFEARAAGLAAEYGFGR